MARQQARMLALTILLVLPLLIGAIIARLWMGTPRPNLWIGVLGLGISYGLLRTRWWRIAPLLAVITALLLPVSTFFGDNKLSRVPAGRSDCSAPVPGCT